MSLDLHSKPFDEGTIEKLWIFRNYINEWLPVFLSKPNPSVKEINICDFFAGPGKDSKGVDGSPLILLKSIKQYENFVKTNNLKVKIYFNDYSKLKIERLKMNIDKAGSLPKNIEITYSRQSFETAFDTISSKIDKSNSANFFFLDQNGIKFITEDVFQKILSFQKTDFIFFISSSILYRFKKHPDIQKYFPDTKSDKFSPSEYFNIHRSVLSYYKSLIPQNEKYFLAPFSIKKGSNIYGLIFGSRHVLGIEKFLKQCWASDTTRGEANFDIDSDNLIENQCCLFPDQEKPKKICSFSKALRDGILCGDLKSNKEIFEFSLSQGFLSSHAKSELTQMLREGLIEKVISVSYESWKKKEEFIHLKKVTHA